MRDLHILIVPEDKYDQIKVDKFSETMNIFI